MHRYRILTDKNYLQTLGYKSSETGKKMKYSQDTWSVVAERSSALNSSSGNVRMWV